MRRRPQRGALCLLLGLSIIACARSRPAQESYRSPPLAGVAAAILDAFADRDLVCLGETHGSRRDAELRAALVDHPGFTDALDVVVVEFANPLHQELLDRLVLGGESLSREELRPIWLDAGLGETWELPVYESFLRSVAAVNETRPPRERIPVVGAALPIDWRLVRTPNDLTPWLDRTAHFESVLRREVLGPGRRGLAIFASGHCERRAPSVLARLAATEPDRVWAVFGFTPGGGVAAGRAAFHLGEEPQLLPVTGTPAASRASGEMFFAGHGLAGARLGELVDAIVYYGSGDDVLLDPADLELDVELRAELDRRARLWTKAKSQDSK